MVERSKETTRVGILGGGQLARMLAEGALALKTSLLDVRVRVLASGPSDPAAQTGVDAIQVQSATGADRDPDALKRFAEGLDVVIFENEFVDCSLLRDTLLGTGSSLIFRPSLEVIERLQDKRGQKQALQRAGIPSARLVEWDGRDAAAWCASMDTEFASGFVLKWARLGYDGKGTWISGSSGDRDSAVRFCEKAASLGVPVFAEEKIAFARELAIIGVRSTTGEFAAYPLVISEQRSGICRKVVGPATAFGIDPRLEAMAKEHARALADSSGIHGAFAIEFFEIPRAASGAGGLCANEIAPRVHNSGHYTLSAAQTSQFENHVRAVLGLPLGSTETAPGFAMLNLIGPEDVPARKAAPPLATEGVDLYWYGKNEVRPGRKMGHLNVRARDPAAIPGLVKSLEAWETRWKEALRG